MISDSRFPTFTEVVYSAMEIVREEEERLLGEPDPKKLNRLRNSKIRWMVSYSTVLHCLLVISILGNLIQYMRLPISSERLTIFSDLRNLPTVVKNEHPEHGVANSEFDGPPSNTSARAWTNLLQPFYFNISKSEVLSAGSSPEISVRVKEGGYLASLAVYHEIHCLNQLRNFLYVRTDPERSSEHDGEYWKGHLGHCIEVLRLSVMCSADLSLYTFTWPQRQHFTFLDAHSRSPRKCVDWNQLEAWSMKRRISLTPTVIYPAEAGEKGRTNT